MPLTLNVALTVLVVLVLVGVTGYLVDRSEERHDGR